VKKQKYHRIIFDEIKGKLRNPAAIVQGFSDILFSMANEFCLELGKTLNA
jgi:hypothetical protein